MIRKFVHISGAVLTAMLLFAATGSAQTFDVSGGYAYRNESGGEGQDRVAIKNGWYGAAGFNLNDSFGVFGQLSQHKTSIDVPVGGGQIVPVDVTLRLYGGGPRISGNQRAPVTYFVQALFGGAQLKTKVGGANSTTSESRFAFQPAVGVDVKAGGTVGVRFEFAPTYIKPDGNEDAWAYHFMVGIVVRGG
jgi:Outer membrane protein beta-barrel domain